MTQNLTRVNSERSEESQLIARFQRRDPSAAPQDDIATQSLKGEGIARPKGDPRTHHVASKIVKDTYSFSIPMENIRSRSWRE
jgi:hypothetical protein